MSKKEAAKAARTVNAALETASRQDANTIGECLSHIYDYSKDRFNYATLLSIYARDDSDEAKEELKRASEEAWYYLLNALDHVERLDAITLKTTGEKFSWFVYDVRDIRDATEEERAVLHSTCGDQLIDFVEAMAKSSGR